MGDFIRYILTGEHDLSLDVIEAGLKAVDAEFSLFRDPATTNSADVLHGSEVMGEIEINRPADQEFQEDIEDLRDELSYIDDQDTTRVAQFLAQATGMVAFQLVESGHDNYRWIDPFWDWLFDHYPGVLQIDEEGYYSISEQLLTTY
ncbi:MAG TPA: hypothetical protein VHD90_24040 [Phototrophicaceae bacterium]|nr:hypothetical protein [Phototrophicaceae bacterium]